jgi:hypothetical protein
LPVLHAPTASGWSNSSRVGFFLLLDQDALSRRTAPAIYFVSLLIRLRFALNGHSFIEQELNRSKVAFRKSDNAFLAIEDVAALQAAADRLSPQIIQKQLDYWTLILGLKFSQRERQHINLSRFYAIGQIEYCR